MFKKIKPSLLLLPILALAWAVFGTAPSALATGEKWELIDKTTIRVSGGAFSGPISGNGASFNNPRSITLKLKSQPNTDPSIWQADSSFRLGAINNGSGYYLEDSAREVGQFCIVVNNFSLLANGREAASFQPIHREDCGKSFGDMRFINPSSTEYMRCGWPTGSRCNTLWATSQTGSLSANATISYAIPGAALKCGDPGFVGPCAQPYNPVTADCTKTDGSAGAQRKCESIKACIVDFEKSAAECTSGWDACISSYTAAGQEVQYNVCATAISKADFEGGKFQTPVREEEDSTNKCQIDGIGWIICPIINFLAGIVDQSYAVVRGLLATPPLNTDTSSPENGTYIAWSLMRNIANVAFVIGFIIIIYSQISGLGVSNYGIKKLLPKLIVAAILVNISYWICAIAVDLSNIAGSAVKSMLDQILTKVPTGDMTDVTTGGNVWGPLAASILSGTILVALGLSVLLPLLIAALAAVVTVLIVLVLRQALLVILIVISPLAFVALLLPNTEDLFKRWRQLFTVLLVMFPIIALIFGGSALASRIIGASTYSSLSGEEYGGNMLLQIVAAGVAIIPLFITPIVMKTAGGVLNRFAGVVNNPNKGAFDRMRKGAEGFRNSRQALRDAKSYNRTGVGRALDLRGYSVRHRNRSDAILKARQREAQIGGATDVANMVENGTGLAAWNLKRGLEGGGGDAGRQRALSNAANTLTQLEIAEVKAAQAILEKLNLDSSQLAQLEQGKGVTVGSNTYQGGTIQKAALSNAVKEQRIANIEAAAKSVENQANGGAALKFLASEIKDNYGNIKGKAVHMVDADGLHKLASGNALTEAELQTATANAMVGIAPELMATQKGVTLDRMEAVKIAAPTSTAAINATTTAGTLKANNDLYDKMGPNERETVRRISI